MPILLIVSVDVDTDVEDITPDQARELVQAALDGDPSCPPATVDIPGR